MQHTVWKLKTLLVVVVEFETEERGLRFDFEYIIVLFMAIAGQRRAMIFFKLGVM